MRSITLDGNNVEMSGYGGILSITSGTVTLDNGSVLQNGIAFGNTGKAGGGIAVDHYDRIYITGGIITECTAKERGAAIEAHGAVDMSGGIITGCTSGLAGAINFFNTGSGDSESRLFLSGSPIIYGNLNAAGQQRNVDVYHHDAGAEDTSAAESAAFGRYNNGARLDYVSLFENDVNNTLVGAADNANNKARVVRQRRRWQGPCSTCSTLEEPRWGRA